MSETVSTHDLDGRPPFTEPIRESAAILSANSRSFWLASRFLPASHRRDAALLYAVCRLIDDLADESDQDAEAQKALNALRDEIRQVGHPRPMISEFLKMSRRRSLDLSYVLELIDGVESDLGVVTVEDDGQLLRYCYRVAGTVGLMMCAVLGVEDPRGLPHAIDLGIAMQLTNICRDVREDARRGRVYLPADRLQEVQTTPEQVRTLRFDSGVLAPVVEDLLDIAERYYESANRGMTYIPAAARLAILVASRVYRAIGVRLRRNGADVLSGRTVVPPWEKSIGLAVATTAWIRSTLPGSKAPCHQSHLHHPLRGLPGVSL